VDQYKHYLFRWLRRTTWRGLKRPYRLDSRCRCRMEVRTAVVGVCRIQLHGLRHAKCDLYRLWWHLRRQCQCQSGCPECPSWCELQIQFLVSPWKETCRDLVTGDGSRNLGRDGGRLRTRPDLANPVCFGARTRRRFYTADHRPHSDVVRDRSGRALVLLTLGHACPL